MQSDDFFYSRFCDLIDGAEEDGANEDIKALNEDGGIVLNENKSQRIKFMMHQLEMVPSMNRDFYCNMMRSYPTSPLYLFLGIGMLGTNVARYSAVRRKSGSVSNIVRTGCFYNFLAPSRFGKGIALGVISRLGNHIEKIRSKAHEK